MKRRRRRQRRVGHHAHARVRARGALALSCNDGDKACGRGQARARADRSTVSSSSLFVLSISHFREEVTDSGDFDNDDEGVGPQTGHLALCVGFLCTVPKTVLRF